MTDPRVDPSVRSPSRDWTVDVGNLWTGGLLAGVVAATAFLHLFLPTAPNGVGRMTGLDRLPRRAWFERWWPR